MVVGNRERHIGWEDGRRADAPGRRPAVARARDRSLPPGGREVAVGDEVEQDHRLGVLVARRRMSAAAQAGGLEVAGGALRRLLAVEEDEHDGRPQLTWLDRPCELDHERGTARAVVRADEPRKVLRVVVGAHDDRPRGSRPGTTPTTLRSPPGTLLEPSPWQLRLQLACELPRGRRSRRPRPELNLAHESRPGCLLVHAIDGRRGGRSNDHERGQRRYGPAAPIT